MPRSMRRRYLALKVASEQSIDRRDVMDAVWDAVLRLFGEYGASQTNLSLMEFNEQRNYAVVRCSHAALEMIRAAITSIREINGKTAVIHVMGVSGTLRALHKKTFS